MNAQMFNSLINGLGVPATHLRAVDGEATDIAKAVSQSIGRAEEALVNSYGVDGRKVHVRASDLPLPPEKFDIFIIGSQRISVIDVQPKLEVGTGIVLGYQCFGKGTA